MSYPVGWHVSDCMDRWIEKLFDQPLRAPKPKLRTRLRHYFGLAESDEPDEFEW